MAGIIILLVLYKFRVPIDQKAEDVSDAMKVSSAKAGVERAKELIEVKKEADALGDIPNADDVLAQLKGKKPTTTTVDT